MNNTKRTIQIEIPEGFMNTGVSINNKLIADTNSTTDFREFAVDLPYTQSAWQIYNINKCTVTLIEK